MNVFGDLTGIKCSYYSIAVNKRINIKRSEFFISVKASIAKKVPVTFSVIKIVLVIISYGVSVGYHFADNKLADALCEGS